MLRTGWYLSLLFVLFGVLEAQGTTPTPKQSISDEERHLQEIKDAVKRCARGPDITFGCQKARHLQLSYKLRELKSLQVEIQSRLKGAEKREFDIIESMWKQFSKSDCGYRASIGNKKPRDARIAVFTQCHFDHAEKRVGQLEDLKKLRWPTQTEQEGATKNP